MRKYLVAAMALAALAVPGSALAQEPPVPPAFAPPVVTPVTDVASAEAFTENYANDNANRFLGERRRNVRVLDTNAACLQSPIVDTRFGCVFTLTALVIQQRRHGWDNWGHGDARSASVRGKRHDRERHRHFRVRKFGCLGFLRIDGGPVVTPTATLINVECRRIPRGDLTVDEPVVTPT